MNSPSPHDRRIDALMARQFRKEGNAFMPASAPTPLTALIRAEEQAESEDPDEFRIKQEGVAKFIAFLFEVGPSPRPVMHRFYSYVDFYHPEFLLNMNASDLAAVFNKTRAAQSAFEKKLLGDIKRRGGYRQPVVLPHQKSQAACRKYAAAQRGNRHRANSVKTAA